mmetsp:Transcript_58574/g.188259  ORF Transcript_58574/g.188259 Transcript_58574/m.188259 type:complete len:375 (-) Transcript_58574:509-1633(-)
MMAIGDAKCSSVSWHAGKLLLTVGWQRAALPLARNRPRPGLLCARLSAGLRMRGARLATRAARSRLALRLSRPAVMVPVALLRVWPGPWRTSSRRLLRRRPGLPRAGARVLQRSGSASSPEAWPSWPPAAWRTRRRHRSSSGPWRERCMQQCWARTPPRPLRPWPAQERPQRPLAPGSAALALASCWRRSWRRPGGCGPQSSGCCARPSDGPRSAHCWRPSLGPTACTCRACVCSRRCCRAPSSSRWRTRPSHRRTPSSRPRTCWCSRPSAPARPRRPQGPSWTRPSASAAAPRCWSSSAAALPRLRGWTPCSSCVGRPASTASPWTLCSSAWSCSATTSSCAWRSMATAAGPGATPLCASAPSSATAQPSWHS